MVLLLMGLAWVTVGFILAWLDSRWVHGVRIWYDEDISFLTLGVIFPFVPLVFILGHAGAKVIRALLRVMGEDVR